MLLANETVVPAAGERTLVCIFLRGAADTLNMVVPYGDDHYYKVRPTLGIPAPSQNKDNDVTSVRLDDFYAFHPKLRALLTSFMRRRTGHCATMSAMTIPRANLRRLDQMGTDEAYGRIVAAAGCGRYRGPSAAAAIRPLGNSDWVNIPASLRRLPPTASAMESIDEAADSRRRW